MNWYLFEAVVFAGVGLAAVFTEIDLPNLAVTLLATIIFSKALGNYVSTLEGKE